MEKIGILKKNNVQIDNSLEFWGDINFYNANLKEYKDSLKDKLENLEYYKNKQDFENYGILAHSTKSEAKYLGFANEAEIFFQHEKAGKERNKEFIDSHYEELENTINKIQAILEEYFASNNEDEKKCILIADDSSIMLNFIEQTIGKEYKIVKVSNGKKAIEKLNELSIYAILLDLNMPNINGFEVLEYLKNNNLIEKIPVVVITGDDSKETIKKAFSYPILDVLNKPFKENNIQRILVSIKSFYEKN